MPQGGEWGQPVCLADRSFVRVGASSPRLRMTAERGELTFGNPFSSPLLSSGTVSPHHPITLRLQPELDTDRVRVTQNQTDWQTILLLLVITKTFL